MKKVLVLAAIGEAALGLALLVVPSLVGRLLFGAELTGVAIPVARVARHRLDRIGYCLLALRVCIPRTLRDVDLQRAYHGVSSCISALRRGSPASSVAGSCVACSPDAASRAGLVQATRGQSNITIGRSVLCLTAILCIALKSYRQLTQARQIVLTQMSR